MVLMFVLVFREDVMPTFAEYMAMSLKELIPDTYEKMGTPKKPTSKQIAQRKRRQRERESKNDQK